MAGGLEGLEVQVKGLGDLIEALRGENKDDHKEIKEGLAKLTNRVGANEVEIARLKERQNIMTFLASAIGVVASAIAAWLGVKQ